MVEISTFHFRDKVHHINLFFNFFLWKGILAVSFRMEFKLGGPKIFVLKKKPNKSQTIIETLNNFVHGGEVYPRFLSFA